LSKYSEFSIAGIRFANLSAAISGLALGISSLGLLWQKSYGLGQDISAIIAVFILLLVTFKYLLTPAQLKADLQHPVLGSSLPTYTMTWMVVSVFVHQYSVSIALFIWVTAILLHFTLSVAFAYFQFSQFNVMKVLPSWFIPPIGIVVAAVTYQKGPFELLAHLLLDYGFIWFLILLPIVLYRLIKLGNVPDPAKPAVAVLAAPASLTLTGYLTMTAFPNIYFAFPMVILAIVMTWGTYALLLGYLRMPFSPSNSAYTFPLVISATACAKFTVFLESQEVPLMLLKIFQMISLVEIAIATLMVFYITFRYCMLLSK
jgi:tellurite resistance protein TehA-like permease